MSVSLFLAALLAASPSPASPARATDQADLLASDSLRSDARLADVCFVSARFGWAVGDRGAIWHTENGGQSWRLQASGVTCPLRCVCFIDEKTGWVAGGISHPYLHNGSGLLLTTRDGGRTWSHNPKLLLPVLTKVRFFDTKRGWALACPSAIVPSGLMRTDDGGQSWQPLSGEATAPWLAGDFIDPVTGALGARDGAAALVQRGAVQSARLASFGLRNLRQIKLSAPVSGWLVGDGGLIMTTSDLGATWQTPPVDPLPEIASQFDFAALAVRGPKCWIAGTPGSRVFHSADGGHTWTAAPTGTPLPIYALTFADDEHGWAVGALGTILTTSNGGQTWQRQRAGGTRVALLGLFSEPNEVPLELLARLSGNDGYLSSIEVLNRRDVETRPRGEIHLNDRFHEATVAVGASDTAVAWRFPLRQTGIHMDARQVVEAWDRANDGRGLQELQRYVVRQIRVWRPEVIVTHDASPHGDDPCGHLVNQVVLQAAEQATDPRAYPEQIAQAGLAPWEIKKVYAALPVGAHGTHDLTTAQLASRWGRSLADLVALPRGLIDDEFHLAPPSLGFQLLCCRLPQQQGRSDFFAAIPLYPGGDARRELLDPPAESLDLLRRVVQRRRNVQVILEQADKDTQAGAAWLANTSDLVRDLDPDNAAYVLFHLAQRYHRNGRWPLAAQTYSALVDRYPQHALAAPALLWLVQYYASTEAAWRTQGGQRYTTSHAAAQPEQGQRYAIKQASNLAIESAQDEDRPGQAAQIGKQIEQTRPGLFTEPALRFPLAVAHRSQGLPRQSERFYLLQSRRTTHDSWWACAQGEVWLAEPKGQSPKPVLRCVTVQAKPRLDGRLDDEAWRQAKPAALVSAQHDDAEWPAVVSLAHDDQFLYIAVNCRRAPGVRYDPANGPRPRDPDLAAQDRVEILLDLDRDYATYYRLTIDHRGWVAESCWGDSTWNPSWFVAAHAASDAWSAEAAIPLDQITGRYPTAHTVWALGLQRTVPGVGFQSWTTPAAHVVIPEGFGYLVFE